jgi:hypothetical protein
MQHPSSSSLLTFSSPLIPLRRITWVTTDPNRYLVIVAPRRLILSLFSTTQVQKKKLWEAVQPDLKTDEQGIASFKGMVMLTSAGAIKAPTLTSANIS